VRLKEEAKARYQTFCRRTWFRELLFKSEQRRVP
jgi:hypothetical protein